MTTLHNQLHQPRALRRYGHLIEAAARWRGKSVDTEGSAGRPADGFSPVSACLLARRLTQRAEMQGLWGFGCAQGGIVSARAKPSTRCRCGQRGSVLPNVALRSVRVSVMLVHRPDAPALAKACGRGVQARLQGSWQRTGGRTRVQDTQPANRTSTSGCLSPLSLLFAPNICMLTYTHVHTIYICTHISLYSYLHKYTHAYLHTYIHTCLHTYIYAYIQTYTHTSIPLYMCAYI